MKPVDGLLIMGIGLIVVGIGMNYRESQRETKVELVRNGAVSVSQSDIKVKIDIEGEVIKPGVYELVVGSRVNDVLVAAGGLAEMADREWVDKNLNKAQVVADGQKIYIPRRQLTQSDGQAGVLGDQSDRSSQDELININTAGVEELDRLPGIGVALANRIIDYRNKNGGFRDVNELKLVSGIGDKLFEKISNELVCR